MSEELEAGDRVEWQTSQGPTAGRVERKLTEETQIGDWVARASEEEPQYLVVSDATGAEAAHHPEALRELDD